MPETEPLISVIVPVYNVEKYIKEALQSVVRQTLDKCVEIIVVDDCGTDDSFKIAREYGVLANSPTRQFKFLSNGINKGQAAARNLGLRNATGKYIAFLDSDDCLTPDNLEILLATIQKHNVDIVEASTVQFMDGEDNKETILSHKEELVTDLEILTGLSSKWMPVMWNKIFRRSFLTGNDLLCPEGFFYEDLYWAFKTMVSAQSIYTIPNQLYRYRVRSDSTSHSLTQRHVDSFISLIRQMKSYVEETKLCQHPYFEHIAGTYESVRCLAVNYVFASGSKGFFKCLFDGLASTNICSLRNTLKNRHISVRDKCKITALHMGAAGRAIFELKRRFGKLKKQ